MFLTGNLPVNAVLIIIIENTLGIYGNLFITNLDMIFNLLAVTETTNHIN